MVRKICENCGRSYEAKSNRSKFCKEACKKQAKRKREGAKPKLICELCGKEFQSKRSDTKYCSVDCHEWAVSLQTYRKNTDRYDYLDSVSLGDEEDFLP